MSVIKRIMGEGLDDADDGSPLEVTGPKEIINPVAEAADYVAEAANRLAGLVDRRPNANNPKMLKKLEMIHFALQTILQDVEGITER